MVKEEYNKKGAVLGLQRLVEFHSLADQIMLDISMEGVYINGWSITPLGRPVVSTCGHYSGAVVEPEKNFGGFLTTP